jgi:hypothetical protein
VSTTIAGDERAGKINDVVNLNNKRFSDDFDQMTP